MNKVYSFLMVIFLVTVCFGCKEEHLDLQELYELNGELAREFFFGYATEDTKCKFYIFEPENATEFEFELCNKYEINFDDVEKVMYAKYKRNEIRPSFFAVQFKSVKLAKKANIFSISMRKANIVAMECASAYILFGDYKTVGRMCLSLDGETLLCNSKNDLRTDIIVPKGVKNILYPGLMTMNIKTIKCNEELESMRFGVFSYLPSLEKIELNDGLKEIGSDCFYKHNLKYIVIPKSVKIIGNNAFRNVTLYCETTKKPSGWDKDFAFDNCTVYWGGTWEYVDGVPQPIVSEAE